MKILKITTLLLIISIGFISCKTEKPEYPKFLFVFENPMQELKEGDNLPNSIKSLIEYYEINDEDSECNGKIFAPDINFYRKDLDKNENLGTALNTTGELQKKFGTLSKINLKSMYDADKFKVPKLIVKEGKVKENNKKNSDAIILGINWKKDKLNKIRKKVEQLLCDGTSQITFIVKNNKNNALYYEIDEDVNSDINSPCKVTTISDGLELKHELTKVIDTKRSTTERIRLAEQVWNKYFDNDAYVAKYLSLDDKNSEIWEIGEGKEYFTSRLAILKSIYDVNIFRIEYSKEDPKRITGLHVIECHNASQKL